MQIEVRIYSLTQVGGQCVIVLEELNGPRLLPIWIGLYEGGSIGMALSGQKFPRPLTHDLFMIMLENLNAVLEKVIVTKIKDSTFFAELHLKHNGKVIVMDARPSDSIALAVRSNCGLFIDEEVFTACPEILKPITDDEVTEFKEKLKNITPEDFFKDLKKKIEGEEDKKEDDDKDEDSSQG